MDNHIVTVESFHGSLLLRVAAPLYLVDMDKAERRLQEAAMRDHGQYHFSVRELAGFALAEITAHGVTKNEDIGTELRCITEQLNECMGH